MSKFRILICEIDGKFTVYTRMTPPIVGRPSSVPAVPSAYHHQMHVSSLKSRHEVFDLKAFILIV